MKRGRGILLTFEGIEGSGKTTQLGLLKKHLEVRGLRVETTREPGGTSVGQQIREILLHGKEDLNPVSEALLFMASRSELVRQVIKPWLEAGAVVLCDRWVDATVAYQGFGSGLPISWIRAVMKRVTDGVEPDLTFFLDLPAATGLARASKRGKLDRMESREMAFHRRVLRGYRSICRSEPRRVIRIPVAGKVESTHRAVAAHLERRLGGRLAQMAPAKA